MFANSTHFLSVLFQGFLPTVELTVGGIVLTIVDAFAAGLASLSSRRGVRFVVRVYVEGWRGMADIKQNWII
jgi:ABC-type amino acid transport system permease subunit